MAVGPVLEETTRARTINTLEDQIRQRVYELWQQAGRTGDPEGLQAERPQFRSGRLWNKGHSSSFGCVPFGVTSMKRIFSFLIATTAATGAVAQSSQTTQKNMTCGQARALVASQGAVVLRTGPGAFDRYVRDSTFCIAQTTAQPAWVRTADVAQCPIGGTCRPVEIENGQ